MVRNVMGILSAIGTLLISLVLYGYSSDQKNNTMELNQEKEIRMIQDSILFSMWDEHKEKHQDEEKQRLEREKLERDYFDAKFDGLEKLIQSN